MGKPCSTRKRNNKCIYKMYACKATKEDNLPCGNLSANWMTILK